MHCTSDMEFSIALVVIIVLIKSSIESVPGNLLHCRHSEMKDII